MPKFCPSIAQTALESMTGFGLTLIDQRSRKLLSDQNLDLRAALSPFRRRSQPRRSRGRLKAWVVRRGSMCLSIEQAESSLKQAQEWQPAIRRDSAQRDLRHFRQRSSRPDPVIIVFGQLVFAPPVWNPASGINELTSTAWQMPKYEPGT